MLLAKTVQGRGCTSPEAMPSFSSICSLATCRQHTEDVNFLQAICRSAGITREKQSSELHVPYGHVLCQLPLQPLSTFLKHVHWDVSGLLGTCIVMWQLAPPHAHRCGALLTASSLGLRNRLSRSTPWKLML